MPDFDDKMIARLLDERDGLIESLEVLRQVVREKEHHLVTLTGYLADERARLRYAVKALEWHATVPARNNFRIVDSNGDYVSDMANWGELARKTIENLSKDPFLPEETNCQKPAPNMGNVVPLKVPAEPLKCRGVGRDAENPKALIFSFSRPPTDDDLRYLHEVMQRAAVCHTIASKG